MFPAEPGRVGEKVGLGHAKPSFTSDVYGSVLPPMEREAVEATAHDPDGGGTEGG